MMLNIQKTHKAEKQFKKLASFCSTLAILKASPTYADSPYVS